jgi:DNA-binding transcriptional ArsR family regulator
VGAGARVVALARLALTEALVAGLRHVGALVHATGLTQSNASRHLACQVTATELAA